MDLPIHSTESRLTAAQAAHAVNVSRQLLNSWRVSGKLMRGTDGLYRYGDVLAVEQATRSSGYSHRLVAA